MCDGWCSLTGALFQVLFDGAFDEKRRLGGIGKWCGGCCWIELSSRTGTNLITRLKRILGRGEPEFCKIDPGVSVTAAARSEEGNVPNLIIAGGGAMLPGFTSRLRIKLRRRWRTITLNLSTLIGEELV
ncbi:hypothetical protein BY996DRAFT_6415655 [Phakopsora pachyrhizi]|nr:hypothetical protein BY996DRAFT_6415655 [Phakopsora pachyrhizi]